MPCCILNRGTSRGENVVGEAALYSGSWRWSGGRLFGLDAVEQVRASVYLDDMNRLKVIRRHLRRSATPAEQRLWRMLRRQQLGGRKFRRQHPVGPYVVDFYCAEERLAIELDGAVHDDPARRDADFRRQREIEATGIRVLRFENRAVLETPDVVCDAIASCFNADPAQR